MTSDHGCKFLPELLVKTTVSPDAEAAKRFKFDTNDNEFQI